MDKMDIQKIMEFLPHRYPFLMLDRVIDCDTKNGIVAIKNVTINEPFFAGHFPHFAVMPGVLIVEAMAQASAILAFNSLDMKNDPNNVYFFVGIDKARFKKPVVPGDTLRIEGAIVRTIKGIWKFKSRAMVADELVAEAELMCTMKRR